MTSTPACPCKSGSPARSGASPTRAAGCTTAATSLDQVIEHGGEDAASREGFRALDFHAKGDLRVFLMSLRRQWRPTVL